MCRAIRYLDPASVRWVDDQQQESGGSGGGDTLIMLCNHIDTILMLSQCSQSDILTDHG